LPDRNSGKAYRLQIAAYSTKESAVRVASYVRTAGGIYTEIETTDSIFRVLTGQIAARDIYAAVVKLGSLGFGEIWVRE